jgi:F420-dependent oxidoreductase-like protein
MATDALRFRIFVEPQEGASYDDQLVLARLAEEHGFDAFFRSDHYISFFGGDGLPGPTDAWTTLAGLARDTSTIRLGTLVSPVTFRFPGPLAIAVAQVDAMSEGRVELGLGAGWNDTEHRAYAVPFPDLGERFERFEEQLAIVTGLWTTPSGERFSFSGRHYEVVDSPALPKPIQAPHPPIIIGGAGTRRTPRLAARYASEFNIMFAMAADVPPIVERLHRACDAIGRDPSTLGLGVANTLVLGRDDAEVERRATAIGRTAEIARFGFGGTATEVIDRIAEYRAHGVDTVYLQCPDLRDLDQVHLFAAEVAPAFR